MIWNLNNVFRILTESLLLPFTSAASTAERIVVLTFDRSFRSHRTLVAPFLKELGFRATFFVTHAPTDDSVSLSWQEIAEIDRMGFEIGNYGWSCLDLSVPRNAARLLGNLALVEFELDKVKVPRPISFAYCKDSFGPEALKKLTQRGYRFARRGTEPKLPNPGFQPRKHHPLLIPTSGSIDSDWTLERFTRLVEYARDGEIVVLRFGQIGDRNQAASTVPGEKFREYMLHLKEEGYTVVALRDLEDRLSWEMTSGDIELPVRYPEPEPAGLLLPVEMESTRRELDFWLENMFRYHRYTPEEAVQVTGLNEDVLQESAKKLELTKSSSEADAEGIRVLPYPGGRHPRIDHLEAAIDPMRGTKASVFLPWKGAGYVVVDLPETLETQEEELLFLAHTHVPTVWHVHNRWLENIDWNRTSDGALSQERVLPNQVAFGASIRPDGKGVSLELWVRNGSSKTLRNLRAAICVMLKGASDFNTQTRSNKIFRCPASAVRSATGNRWILIGWDHCATPGGQPKVPCLHADPVFEACPPGQTVRARGRLWFYEGDGIEEELEKSAHLFR